MSVEQSSRVKVDISVVKPRIVFVDAVAAATLEEKIVAINRFFPDGFVSVAEFQQVELAAKTIKARQDSLPKALIKPLEPIIEAPGTEEEEENKKDNVIYSPREHTFLNLYKDSQTVSKGQIIQILAQTMKRPPTSQDIKNFLREVRKKLGQEGKELVNLTPRHSGDAIYRLAPLGFSPSLKPTQRATVPRLRSIDDGPDELDLLEEVDDADLIDDSFPNDLTTDRVIFWEKRRPAPPKPEPTQTLSIEYKKVKAPNGREITLRPKELIIYLSIMAGKSQREIIDESFNGNDSRFFTFFSNLTFELSQYGYCITSNFDRESERHATFYTIAEKTPQEPEPQKVEREKEPDYVSLNEKDIENIISPVENRTLTVADIRVLVAIIKSPENEGAFVHNLAKLLNPSKISGFSEEIASLPSRIKFYNEVVLKDTLLTIRSKTSRYDDPGGYYIRTSWGEDYKELSLREKITILQRQVEKISKDPQKKDDYGIKFSQSDGLISLFIVKNGEKTKPVILKDIVVQDSAEAVRRNEEGQIAKPITYTLTASNQARIVRLLFQSGPIATRIIRTRLADDKAQISQRELQLYIDSLNGTLPTNNENGKLNTLLRLGLCIIKEISEDEEECIALARYDPQNIRGVSLSGQYETVEDEAPPPWVRPRQRKRRPSHGKSRL